MARVTTYLNFNRRTEQAFLFYQSVFGTEFSRPMLRYNDIPGCEGQPPLAEADKNLVMHVELPIFADYSLMGSDSPDSMGPLTQGNNVTLNLEPDTRAETERLFNALGQNGKIVMLLQDMFWGGYFGLVEDQFGIHWMFNGPAPEKP